MPIWSYGRAMSWHAQRDPDAPALACEGETRTRGALERRANRLARAYAERGVRAGDLVTLALPNGLEFFEACLAIWKLGATPNPISARLPELERRALVELARPALLVGAEPGAYGGRPTLPADFEPEPEHGAAPLPDALPPHARAMTSGGSTGRPKLILDLAPGCCDPEVPENGMRAGGSTLVAGPLYHAGPFLTAWQQLLCGGRVVVMPRFDAARALELVERERVEWVLFVPTMMLRIWRLPPEQRAARDLSSLRRVMCTGAPCPAWLKRAWIGWLGPDAIWEAYGGSERIAGTLISGREWLAHPGSVGRPTGGRRIRVLRPDGSECAPGEVGELFLMPAAGPGTTYRYVGAAASVTPDGWESLGDMGWLDEEGWLYLADRKTDMILCGGANVYPAEVEAALEAHPAVRSSAVIGLPDEDLGQRIHAIVDAVAPIDDETLREHLAKHLARHKIPRSFDYVSEPLRDDAGKLRRSALREARLCRARAQDLNRAPARSPTEEDTTMPRDLSLREISDRIAIQDLLVRYTVAIDTKDWSLLDTCFTPDAHVDYTQSGGVAGRYPEVRAWLEKALAIFPVTQHFIGNTTLSLEGERAKARTYVINPMVFANPDGSQHIFTVGAYYNDRLVHTDAGWRIAERIEEQAYLDGSLPEALRIPS